MFVDLSSSLSLKQKPLDLRDKKTPGDDGGYESRKRRYSEQGRERARERFTGNRVDERRSEYVGLGSGGNGTNAGGGGGGGSMMRRRDDDEEDDEERRGGGSGGGGGRNSRRSAGCKRFLQTFTVTFERSV